MKIANYLNRFSLLTTRQNEEELRRWCAPYSMTYSLRIKRL